MTSPEWHPDDERLLGRYLDSHGRRRVARSPSGRLRRVRGALPIAGAGARGRLRRRRVRSATRPFRLPASTRNVGRSCCGSASDRTAACWCSPSARPRRLPRGRLAVAAALILMTTTGLLRILSGQPPAISGDPQRSRRDLRLAPQPSARQEAVYLDIEMALARHRDGGAPGTRRPDAARHGARAAASLTRSR